MQPNATRKTPGLPVPARPDPAGLALVEGAPLQLAGLVYEADCDLKPSQHKAIAALAAGATVAAAAAASGVDRATLWRWRNEGVDFICALNRALRDQADAIAAARRELALEAVVAIRSLLGADNPPAIRLRAATAALQGVGGLDAPQVGETDPDALRRQREQARLWDALTGD